jgi:hypothetical protein
MAVNMAMAGTATTVVAIIGRGGGLGFKILDPSRPVLGLEIQMFPYRLLIDAEMRRAVTPAVAARGIPSMLIASQRSVLS